MDCSRRRTVVRICSALVSRSGLAAPHPLFHVSNLAFCAVAGCKSPHSNAAFQSTPPILERITCRPSLTAANNSNVAAAAADLLREETHCHSASDELNLVCKLLSNNRFPLHPLESCLDSASVNISVDLVQGTLKRCSHLWISAHRFFNWAATKQGYRHDPETCNIMIDILGSFRQFDFVWDLLTQMQNQGPCISHKTFFIIMKRYARAGLPQDAIRTFTVMENFECKPTIDDFVGLLSVLSRNRLTSHVHSFHEQFRHDFPADVKIYSILIKSCGDVGDTERAQKIFAEMMESGCVVADVLVYNALLGCLCRAGLMQETYTLYQQMKAHGPCPDASTYNTLIQSHCTAGRLKEAFRVLRVMKRHGFVAEIHSYHDLIQGLCSQEKVFEAEQLLEDMASSGVQPDAWSCYLIIRVHCKYNKVKRALWVLNKMDKSGCKPDCFVYNVLLKMLLSVGRYDKAFEIWEHMDRSGVIPSATTYSAMIHGLCKRHKSVEACRFFESMILEGIPPYPCTCILLKNLLVRVHDRNALLILEEKMSKSVSSSIRELSSLMKPSVTSARKWKLKIDCHTSY